MSNEHEPLYERLFCNAFVGQPGVARKIVGFKRNDNTYEVHSYPSHACADARTNEWGVCTSGKPKPGTRHPVIV